jgi:hypothetical protein
MAHFLPLCGKKPGFAGLRFAPVFALRAKTKPLQSLAQVRILLRKILTKTHGPSPFAHLDFLLAAAIQPP